MAFKMKGHTLPGVKQNKEIKNKPPEGTWYDADDDTSNSPETEPEGEEYPIYTWASEGGKKPK
jgi:hypothetical protein